MPILTVQALEKSFGTRVLLSGADLVLDRGERVGLIGDNGSGKSTLFRILAGQMEAESGTITLPRTVKLGYLEQDAQFEGSETVIDEAERAFARLHDLSHRLRDLEHRMAEHVGEELEKALKSYQSIQQEFDIEGGYAWRHRLEATLLGVGLDRTVWEQPLSTLSGGQRSRLALAKLLLESPDVLLLDEPTNHLDVKAIEWLEDFLLQFSGALMIISHDRYLLERLCTRIVWLTESKLKSYPGSFSAFLAQKQVEETTRARAYEQQQEQIEKTRRFIDRFRAGQRSKEAKGRAKRLERLLQSDQLITRAPESRRIHLGLHTDQRAGDRVLGVRELCKSFGTLQLWRGVAFEVRRGERVGIIGPNGSGKTTLLKVLRGAEDADGGMIRWGANLNVGYYDQRLDDFDPESTVLEELAEGRVEPEQKLREAAAVMLFRGDDVEKRVSMLSGGERARLALARLLLDKPNVLLLDEPTNHLDINSAEALEQALKAFEGTILCVSHDRFFLDRVVERLLVLDPPGLVDFSGNYTRWHKRQLAREKASRQQEAPSRRKTIAQASPPAVKPRRDNPYTRPFGRLSLEQLEQEIHTTEQLLSACQSSFSDPLVMRNPEAAQKLHAEMEALSRRLAGLEEEYFARS
jgi:ATP-binding cassette subfamily F protein 3